MRPAFDPAMLVMAAFALGLAVVAHVKDPGASSSPRHQE